MDAGREVHLAAAGEGEGVIGATRDPCKVYAFQRFEYARVACAAALLSYAWTVHVHFAGQRLSTGLPQLELLPVAAFSICICLKTVSLLSEQCSGLHRTHF